eukprot:2679198-Prymnesium_polylepis.1
MAAMLGASVLLTDIEVAQPALRYNSAVNLRPDERERVKVVTYEWGVTPSRALLQEPLLGGRAAPDVILCAGVLYMDALVAPLCQALRALVGRRTVVLIFVRSRPGTVRQPRALAGASKCAHNITPARS